MHDYHANKLPSVFNHFFLAVCDSHVYTTRLATKTSYSAYCIPLVTNYGKFSLRSQGPNIWNKIDESLKILTKSIFKKKIKSQFINEY
jgi:hypothetical protein